MDTETGLFLKNTGRESGIFAARDFSKGDRIIEFQGDIFHNAQIPPLVTPEDDRYVQFGEDLYLGPSGGLDDWFNHSCAPNSGLAIKGGHVWLVAVKSIARGEEITWDYSTTMDEDDWEMDCHCGSKNCRKRIRDFKYLPNEIQKKYAKLGIVPDYNLKYLAA